MSAVKKMKHAAVDHLPSKKIIAKLAVLEAEIQDGMNVLEGMLKA